MTDTTLSLAARLAANLIVDAIKLAKPGARAVAKVGDRALNLIGGAPFSEREAHRFLLDGADAPNKAEAQVDSLDPWCSDGGPIEWMNQGHGSYRIAPHGFNTMPNWPQSYKPDPKPPGYWLNAIENTIKDHADFLAPQSSAPSRKLCGACDYTDNGWCPCACHEPSAPVAPKPTDVAGSPEVVASPAAASGSLIPNGPEYRIGAFGDPNADVHLCTTWDGSCHCEEVKALPDFPDTTVRSVRVEVGHGMGLSAAAEMFPQHTKTPDSQGEQPVGAGVTGPGTDGSGLICGVMSQHWFHVDRGDEPFEYSYSCRSPMGELCETFPTRGYPGAVEAWQAHIAPLIVAALNTQK